MKLKNFDDFLNEDLSVGPNGELSGHTEDPRNLRARRKDAHIELSKKWNEDNASTKIEVGDFVKKTFFEGKRSEAMWVEVTEVISDQKFRGKLANDPVAVNNLQIEDMVDVDRSEIEELLRKNEQ